MHLHHYLVWIAIFLVLPSLILIFLALTSYDFSPNAEFSFTIENWKYVFGSEYASNVFWPAVIRSVLISLCVTLLCLIIGYPVALFMTKMNRIARGILMAFLILPLWCNQVLRIVSWRTIFEILKLDELSRKKFLSMLVSDDRMVIVVSHEKEEFDKRYFNVLVLKDGLLEVLSKVR